MKTLYTIGKIYTVWILDAGMTQPLKRTRMEYIAEDDTHIKFKNLQMNKEESILKTNAIKIVEE